MLGFMQPIGGKVISYKVDIEASKKLDNLKDIIPITEEANCKDEEYCRGVRETLKTVKEIINK